MLFLLGPGRNSFIGRVISSIRSALLVGLALAAVPHVNAFYRPAERSASAAMEQPEALRGGGAWGGAAPGLAQRGCGTCRQVAFWAL